MMKCLNYLFLTIFLITKLNFVAELNGIYQEILGFPQVLIGYLFLYLWMSIIGAVNLISPP